MCTKMFRKFINKIVNVRNFSSGLTEVKINQKGVAILSMNRPPVNALNYDFHVDLQEKMAMLEKEKIKGLILTSKVPNIFCAGVDLSEFYKTDEVRLARFWESLQRIFMALYGASFPMVAFINGHAIAGGCFFAVCCDYRIMYPNYKIGANEVAVGIGMSVWLNKAVMRVMGTRKGEFACTSGTLYKTDEALKNGLIDEIATDEEDGMAKAYAFLKHFEKVHDESRAWTKKAIRADVINELERDFDKNIEKHVKQILSPSAQEHLGKFIESTFKKNK